MKLRLIRRKDFLVYYQNVIIFFVAAFVSTRIILIILDYPKISPGNLHIAHILWGGLILFAAAMLILLYRNKSLLYVSSALIGLGWALFVDEIGKTITPDNNYFYEPALPLIYISLLILWFIFRHFHKKRGLSEKNIMYNVLEEFEEVIENDLDPQEFGQMKKQLINLKNHAKDSNIRIVAEGLLAVISQQEISLQKQKRFFFEEIFRNYQKKIYTLLHSRIVKRWIFPFMLLCYGFGLLLLSTFHFIPFLDTGLANQFHSDLNVDVFKTTIDSVLFIILNLGQFGLGITLVLSAMRKMMLEKQPWSDVRIVLFISITVLDILLFYFSQFPAILFVSVDILFFYFTNLYIRYRPNQIEI